MTPRRKAVREREHEILEAVLAGGSLRGVGIMYGITYERVRQIVVRALKRLAEQYHEDVPTIPQARENASRWRVFMAQEKEGWKHGHA